MTKKSLCSTTDPVSSFSFPKGVKLTSPTTIKYFTPLYEQKIDSSRLTFPSSKLIKKKITTAHFSQLQFYSYIFFDEVE